MRVKKIQDKFVTDKMFNDLCEKVSINLISNDKELNQQNIIDILLDENITYKTIARVVNTFCNSKATEGSIASQVRLMEKKLQVCNNNI
jgi:hypothetical protein